MPPAVIAGAIAAGGAVTGAVISSKAAKGAAKTQTEAGNKALDLQREIYGQQKQLLNPYVNAGSESLGRLMSQHWGTPYQGPGSPGILAPNPYAPTPQSLGIQNGMPQRPPQAMSLGQMAAPQGAPQRPQGGDGMVIVEAPTGERQRLPLYLAQQAQAKGARILGGS
jgi:hypothetical protein